MEKMPTQTLLRRFLWLRSKLSFWQKNSSVWLPQESCYLKTSSTMISSRMRQTKLFCRQLSDLAKLLFLCRT